MHNRGRKVLFSRVDTVSSGGQLPPPVTRQRKRRGRLRLERDSHLIDRDDFTAMNTRGNSPLNAWPG